MHDYILLVSESTGLHLCDGTKESGLGLRPHCDDNFVWEWEGDSSLRNAATGARVRAEQCGERPGPKQAAEIDARFGAGASLLVSQKYRLVGDSQQLSGLADQLVFSTRPAPARLPSAYLADLEKQGWTVVENVMSPAMVSNLTANINAVREKNAEKEARVKADQDSRPYSSNDNVIRPRSLMGEGESFLGMTPTITQALMHPVSLWLIESYLGVDDIHYCQCPGFSILRPAEKTGESARVMPGGWHADYPYPLTSETEAHTYRLGPEEFEKLDASISPRFPDWKRRKHRLGMQFNIALTDFTPETGATQFVLGSHEFDTPPPTELNAVPTVAGEGPHKDVVQMSFPAGSGILYDSRTYHRAPPELNISGKERWAMLTCIVPSFVRDLRARDDKVESADAFANATDVHAALTPRELRDVLKMLCDDEAGQPRRDIETAVAAALQR
ncbi:MAG: phytanoyl-CoA dioxygenase family protein [Proteobacteria bacterium]|nr:phytanoyl-CoA dioxygenase family protein [Pseudomonadota bacterium]